MKEKPWPIIILALCHFIEPVCKFVFYSWYGGTPLFSLIRENLIPFHWISFIVFFSFPLAGVAIYAVKKWSLPVFFAIECLTIVLHWHMLGEYSNLHIVHLTYLRPPILFTLFTVINMIVVFYFLHPAVRIAYLDPKIRWWESLPRYEVNWGTNLKQGAIELKGSVLNISENGAFIFVPPPSSLKTDVPVQLGFSFGNLSFLFQSEIVHGFSFKGQEGYGIKFSFASSLQKDLLKKCMKAVKLLNYERTIKPVPWFESFQQWGKSLLTSKEGLVPKVVARSSKAIPNKK